MVPSMILWWPVGGAKSRIKGRQRFSEHLDFVASEGLQAVVGHVAREGKAFNADPRGGPWASVIKRDAQFAQAYVRQDVGKYKAIVHGMSAALVDRDTSPGAEPEDILQMDIAALIVPARDESHPTSAARHLQA